MPQIAHGLAHHVAQEGEGDVAEQANAPVVAATHGLVDVKSRAAVLGLFGAVPQPQGAQTLFGAGQGLGVAQHPVGEQGREVLGGRRGSHMHARIAMGIGLEAAQGPALDFIAETELFQLQVEKGVNAPVRGLLADKALDFGSQPVALGLWQGLDAVAHRIHEVLLAHGKAHGKGVEKGRSEGIASVPAGGKGRLQIDQQLAHHKFGHGLSPVGMAGLSGFNTQVYCSAAQGPLSMRRSAPSGWGKAQRWRGSSASRRPSPSRLKESTSRKIDRADPDRQAAITSASAAAFPA